MPRTRATSWAGRLRWGEGRRAFNPLSAGGSLEKLTSSSGSAASERTATLTARLKGSAGLSGLATLLSLSWPTGVWATQVEQTQNRQFRRWRHLGGPFARCRYELAGHDI